MRKYQPSWTPTQHFNVSGKIFQCDGSIQTYLSTGVVAELGSNRIIQKSQVNLLNEEAETFETTAVEFQLMSLNGDVHTIIEILTVQKVTDDLKGLDWKKACGSWDSMKEV